MLITLGVSAEDDAASLLSVGRSVQRSRQSEKLVQRAGMNLDVVGELEVAVAGKSCHNFLSDDGKVHGVNLGFNNALELPGQVYALMDCARFLQDQSNTDYEAKCSSRAKLMQACMVSARKVCVWSNKQFKAGEKKVSTEMRNAGLAREDIRLILEPFRNIHSSKSAHSCGDLFAGTPFEDVTVDDLKQLVPVVPRWIPADASSSLMSMVDESCQDASAGCKGGCYVGPSEAFFNDCMIGRSPVVGIIMEKPKLIAGDHCTSAGFQPLILPDNAGNTEPDGCYGGANSRVSFYTSDQAWFWEATASGFNPEVDCPAWQEANPTCFDTVVAAQ